MNENTDRTQTCIKLVRLQIKQSAIMRVLRIKKMNSYGEWWQDTCRTSRSCHRTVMLRHQLTFTSALNTSFRKSRHDERSSTAHARLYVFCACRYWHHYLGLLHAAGKDLVTVWPTIKRLLIQRRLQNSRWNDIWMRQVARCDESG